MLIDFPGIFLFTWFLDLCDKSRLSIFTYALPLVPVLLAFCSIFNILFSYKLYTCNYVDRKLCNHGSADCTTKLQEDFCNLDFPGISIRMFLLIITCGCLGNLVSAWKPFSCVVSSFFSSHVSFSFPSPYWKSIQSPLNSL